MPPDNPGSDKLELGNWTHTFDETVGDGLAIEVVATANECDSVAKSLGLISCKNITAKYELVAETDDQARLKGTLHAQVTQECIVTLEPLTTTIVENLDAVFAHQVTNHQPHGYEDQKILTDVTVEAIDDDTIHVGTLCYETLASALDPYPRKQAGGAFAEPLNVSSKPADADAGPFASLATLREKNGANGD